MTRGRIGMTDLGGYFWFHVPSSFFWPPMSVLYKVELRALNMGSLGDN